MLNVRVLDLIIADIIIPDCCQKNIFVGFAFYKGRWIDILL